MWCRRRRKTPPAITSSSTTLTTWSVEVETSRSGRKTTCVYVCLAPVHGCQLLSEVGMVLLLAVNAHGTCVCITSSSIILTTGSRWQTGTADKHTLGTATGE